jgi:hypothetical protein
MERVSAAAPYTPLRSIELVADKTAFEPSD